MSQFKGYAKDILMLDFEGVGAKTDDTTGDITDVRDPSQLGAVLLDKVTLEEKDSFLSFIFTKEDIYTGPNHVSGITEQDLVNAPTQKAVIEKFIEQFGDDVYLASWNTGFDMAWLGKLLANIGRTVDYYDYHHLDIWPLAYTYLCQLGHPEIIRSEDTFRAFGQLARTNHDALDDSRRTAEVLRAVVFKQPLTI